MKIVEFEDGMTEQTATELFEKIAMFASYGFNKSHAVEYTMISYQVMWLKTNYPVEFYAAGLTNMDEDKLPGLLRDAKASGIAISMPDINHSTGRFEIVTDKKLAVPFQRIKGISALSTAAILAARVAGPFLSKDDFIKRVERKRCNVRHQEILNLIGAFANIEPDQLPSDDPTRVRDQIELIPGLISANVPINRDMLRDTHVRSAIFDVIDAYRAEYGPASAKPDGMQIKPTFGKAARFMIIADAPGNDEDSAGSMGFAFSNSTVQDCMSNNGLEKADVYWTALIKRPKRNKTITPEEIAAYRPYLDMEIDALKPTVIVLLGSTVTRAFLKDFKGKASEAAGKVVYSKELDANLVVGFSAGEIYHDPDKINNMNAVFASVAELLA